MQVSAHASILIKPGQWVIRVSDLDPVSTLVRVYVYVCYICVYVYVCMCMYVCVCMCMRVCMYVCVYICVPVSNVATLLLQV